MIFIDTDVAIALRDYDIPTRDRILALNRKPVISVITRIELENGVNRVPVEAERRRRLLDRLMRSIAVQLFTEDDVLCYGRIVHMLGHDRRRTLDRLIAAQAISRDARLITRNGKDFRKIDGLRLEEW